MTKKPRHAPSEDELGRLRLLARMVVDQLELGRAQRAVAEQKRQLELAEMMSGVGHWRYSAATGKVSWSDEVYRIHGVDPASFDPNGVVRAAFFHPDDRQDAQILFERARTL